jgi:hypothetical protein
VVAAAARTASRPQQLRTLWQHRRSSLVIVPMQAYFPDEDHDTPVFAVTSIEAWWQQVGSKRYPKAQEIFITADAGGSNSYRAHVWKYELQRFADKFDVAVRVSHFPPGTSKWNKVEHRLFSFISINWRDRPLRTYETVVNLIANTTNRGGLVVRARLDRRNYPTGKRISKKEFRTLEIEQDAFHGDWNYVIRPRKAKL